MMANSDKPLIIQRRRLEQAGWNESDKLDDVGRNDYSYLIKFCYREASLTTSLVVSAYPHVCATALLTLACTGPR